MKASRFSDAQKAFILKQGADGMPVADRRCTGDGK
jgi:putative transposase